MGDSIVDYDGDMVGASDKRGFEKNKSKLLATFNEGLNLHHVPHTPLNN